MFKVEKPIVGMVQPPPLPGSPKYNGRAINSILKQAVQDAKALENGGINGLIIENLGDAPYLKANVGPETISTMTLILQKVLDAVEVPVGVNVLRNDAMAALAIAHVAGGKFIRVNVFTDTLVTDQGIVEACAPKLLRYRQRLQAGDVKIFADVHVKHGMLLSPRPIEESAKDAAYRGHADALVVTGARTGEAPELKNISRVKKAVPDKPVLVGSGATKENIAELLEHADGAIVGTSLKVGGIIENPVDEEGVKKFMVAVNKIRQKK